MQMVWENLEVPINSLPKVEEVYFQKHPRRYRSYRYVTASLWLVLPVLGFGVAAAVLRAWWPLIVLGAFLLLAMGTFFAISKGYARRSYALRERDLSYRKGWIFTSVTTVPFNRIQHTEVSQGPLERRFKLCTLNIYTAGGSTSDLSVPGLEADEAAQLRDFVARKATQYV
jgi:hypothetical protein